MKSEDREGLKERAYQLFDLGWSARRIALELGLASRTVQRWVKDLGWKERRAQASTRGPGPRSEGRGVPGRVGRAGSGRFEPRLGSDRA